MTDENLLTIGEAATRLGVATSTLRFYETKRLIASVRTEGGQRRYARDVLRRGRSFVRPNRLGCHWKKSARASQPCRQSERQPKRTGNASQKHGVPALMPRFRRWRPYVTGSGCVSAVAVRPLIAVRSSIQTMWRLSKAPAPISGDDEFRHHAALRLPGSFGSLAR